MKFYNYIQLLSLDVVAGACIGTNYISYLLKTPTSWLSTVALGIMIWLIYTLDHLLDARKNDHPSNKRHAFHQLYFRQIFIAWIILALIGLLILPLLPFTVLKLGIVLLSIVVLYFILLFFSVLKSGKYKEAVIALVYSLGLVLIPIALGQNLDHVQLAWIISVYFILAFINLVLFSIYEEEEDILDGHFSIVQSIGQQNAVFFVKVLWLIGMTIVILGEPIFQNYIFVLMFILLGPLLFFRNHFAPSARYRLIGDGIFILPILVLIS